MRYFKNTINEFYAIDAGQEFLIKADWLEVTTDDIEAANAHTPEQLKLIRLKELRSLLADSDYKVLPDYDKPDDGIRAQRQAWREEIRVLLGA
jgi:hypothetical protein